MYSIRACTIADLEASPALPALLAEYAAESSTCGLGGANPQLATYRQLEAAGALHPIGAFYGGDELAGFLLLLVSPVPHFGKLAATTESYFVSAAHRKGGGAGTRLLAAAEDRARELGCEAMFVSAPAGGRLARVMGHKAGYRLTNLVFCMELAE